MGIVSILFLATSLAASPFDGAGWLFPSAVERTAKNTTLEFRRTFTCAAGAKPRLAIAADTVYRVDLNGAFVHAGRFPDVPPERFYDILDLGGVKAGCNELVVSLYVQGVDSYQTIPGCPGVAFRVFGDGTTETGPGEWRRSVADVVADVPRLTYQLGYTFVRDATAGESDWEKLTEKDVVRAASEYRLEPRPVPCVEIRSDLVSKTIAAGRLDGSSVPETMKLAPSMDATKMTPVPLGKFYDADGKSVSADLFCDGFYCVVDFGREETGFVSLDVDTDAGAVLDIGYSEHMENGRLKVSLGDHGFCGRYLARDGRQSWWCWRRRIAGRYLQLHVRGVKTHFRLNRLTLKPAELPVPRLPAPQFADARLRTIREVGVRTLELCMHEHYEDCPWREQALYANDARNQMLAGYYAFGTVWPMPRLAIRLFSRGFDALGWQEMCMPARIADFSIPSFAMCWALSVGDYLEQTGDAAFVREMMPYLKAFLDRRASELADGLLPCPTGRKYWHFYEWTEGMDNWGIRLKDGERVFHAPLNLLLVLALESGAKCADACGDAPSAAKWRKAASEIRPAIAAKFWDGSRREFRTYADGRDHACELVQALALLAQTVPEGEGADLAQRLASACEGARSASSEMGWVKCSLSQLLYKYEALIAAGYGRNVVVELTQKWWRMIEAGATSFWETERGWSDFNGAGSLCHGWSSVPVYLMGRYPELFSMVE